MTHRMAIEIAATQQQLAKQEREIRCFGCSNQAMETLKAALLAGPYPDGLLFGAMSILSDSQELIAMGRADEARQAINRAKWLIDEQRGIDRAAGR